MFCSKCGNELKKDDEYCSKCGTSVKKEDKKSIKISLKKLVVILVICIAVIACVIWFVINNINITKNKNGMPEDMNEATLSSNENTSKKSNSDFLNEIKSKYPSESKNICTDGDNYWLLDTNGEKIYFNDLESFEMANQACFNILHEGELVEDFEKMVDKKTFLSNFSDENKKELASFIKTKPIKTGRLESLISKKEVTIKPIKSVKEYVEDRFIIKDDEIIYFLIYIDSAPELVSTGYVITPAKKVPENLSSAFDLNDYFVIKLWKHESASFGKSYGVTDDDIKKAKVELDKKINDDLEKISAKRDEFFDEKNIPEEFRYAEQLNSYRLVYKDPREEMSRLYLANCPMLRENRKQLSTDVFATKLYPPDKDKAEYDSWRKSGIFCNYVGYCQIINNNKLLYVAPYYNTITPDSFRDTCTTEYFSAGVCFDITTLPFIFKEFTTEQLILTGYLPEYSEKNFVMTSVVTKDGQTKDLSIEEQDEIVKQQNQYIRSYFGV